MADEEIYEQIPAATGDSVDLSRWPLVIASSGMVMGILFSNRLWTCIGKSFPAAAIVSCPLSPGIDQALSGLALLCCCSIIFNKFRLACTITLYVASLVLIAFDVNRFQPWLYEYLIIIFLCTIREKTSHLPPVEVGAKRLQYISVLLIAIYFFSGLEKLNWRFFTVMGPWLLGVSDSLSVSYEKNIPLIFASALLPVTEITVALLLAFRRTRKLGIVIGTMMHASILYILGPFRLNTNPAVWPWNVTQIALLIFCFLNVPKDQSIFKFDRKERPLSTCVMAIVALAIPILGLFQLVDAYPAFSIYTGDVPTGKIMMEKSTYEQLPKWVQSRCGFYDLRTGLWYVDTNDWLYFDTGASAYPSFYCFRQEARKFAMEHPGQLVLLKLYKFPKLTKDSKDHFERFGEAARPGQVPPSQSPSNKAPANPTSSSQSPSNQAQANPTSTSQSP